MNIENFIPTLGKCEKIPTGAFSNSNLVWRKSSDDGEYPERWLLVSRGDKKEDISAPHAVEDICADISKMTGNGVTMICSDGFWIVSTTVCNKTITKKAKKFVDASLKLWFAVREENQNRKKLFRF